MKDFRILTVILNALMVQLPVLAVAIVGLALALINWRKAPRASLWAALGFGMAALLCILVAVSQGAMAQLMNDIEPRARAAANLGYGFAVSVFRAGTYALLLAAVYAGRKSHTANSTPVLQQG